MCTVCHKHWYSTVLYEPSHFTVTWVVLCVQKMRMSNLDILELKCNQRAEPVSKLSSGATAPPPRDIESDEDYIEAVDHPFPQPSRTTSRPKKRRVRWHGSEEETSDTDGDPVSRIYVPNTQPDFDVVIDQVRNVHCSVCVCV